MQNCTKTNKLVVLMEIIAIYSMIHKQHVTTFRDQNAEVSNVIAGSTHIVTVLKELSTLLISIGIWN
jgi:hypothetical protein